MSNKLVQIHFDFHGPFGAEMSNQLVELAESINQEPGFIWKIWTENEANHEAGG
ncbi:monooxygenase, partial [Escherichia coli]